MFPVSYVSLVLVLFSFVDLMSLRYYFGLMFMGLSCFVVGDFFRFKGLLVLLVLLCLVGCLSVFIMIGCLCSCDFDCLILLCLVDLLLFLCF